MPYILHPTAGHVPCPACDGRGYVDLAGHERCNFSRPMSACDGDCPGCGGREECPGCDGTGEVRDPSTLCPCCVAAIGADDAEALTDGVCLVCMRDGCDCIAQRVDGGAA